MSIVSNAGGNFPRTNVILTFSKEKLAKAQLLHSKLANELQLRIQKTLVDGTRGMYATCDCVVSNFLLLTLARFRWVELQIQSLLPLKPAPDIEARLG